jgi:hypothetical protein
MPLASNLRRQADHSHHTSVRDADIKQAKSGNDQGFAKRAQSAADRNANANANTNAGGANTNTSSNTGGQKK